MGKDECRASWVFLLDLAFRTTPTGQKQTGENTAMRKRNWCTQLVALLLGLGLVIFAGCDSGQKALDEITGNRAVKQYHKSKKDIEKISKQQAEKYQNIPDD
jgi:hypothetical protein